MGSQNNKKLALAIDYLSYLGTIRMAPEKMGKSLTLVEDLLADAKPDQKVLDNMVADILKAQADEKLNKGNILSKMRMYGKFGAKNPSNNILSESELKTLKATDLVTLIKNLNSFKHEVIYYGSQTPAELTAVVNQLHQVPALLKPVPARVIYPMLNTNTDKVFMVNYDMKQIEITMLSKSVIFNETEIPIIRLFNEYFGAGMNSIVFQEIREAKALAYSSSALYTHLIMPVNIISSTATSEHRTTSCPRR